MTSAAPVVDVAAVLSLPQDVIEAVAKLASPQRPFIRVSAVIEALLVKYSQLAYEGKGGIVAFRKRVIASISQAVEKGTLKQSKDGLVTPASLVPQLQRRGSKQMDAEVNSDQERSETEEKESSTPRKRQVAKIVRSLNDNGLQQITSVVKELSTTTSGNEHTTTITTTTATVTAPTIALVENDDMAKSPLTIAALGNRLRKARNGTGMSTRRSQEIAASDDTRDLSLSASDTSTRSKRRQGRVKSNPLGQVGLSSEASSRTPSVERSSRTKSGTLKDSLAESDNAASFKNEQGRRSSRSEIAVQSETESDTEDLDAVSNASVDGSAVDFKTARSESASSTVGSETLKPTMTKPFRKSSSETLRKSSTERRGKIYTEPLSSSTHRKRTRSNMNNDSDQASQGFQTDQDTEDEVDQADINGNANEKTSRVKRRKADVGIAGQFTFVPNWINRATDKVQELVDAFYPPWECSFL